MPTESVERRLSILTGWVTAGLAFILVFSISVMGIMVWQSYRLGENASQLKAVAVETHGSLCALKLDLRKRHADGVKYQKEHPEGLVSHGEVLITPAQIQQSLANQAATLAALRGLGCD